MWGFGIVGKTVAGIVVTGGVGTAVIVGVVSSCGPGEAVVAGIVDGDTLDVRVGGRDERIRLLNIDTPEVGDCLADEATAFLAGRAPVGSTVRLEYDEVRLDPYGRTLAGVFAGDELVNASIARAGLGAPVVFDDNDRFLPPVEQAAATASADGIGLHSAMDVSCTVPALAAALDRTVAENPTVTPPDGAASADLVAAGAAPESVLLAADRLIGLLSEVDDPAVAALAEDVRLRIGEEAGRIRTVASQDLTTLTQAAATRQAAEQAEAARIAEEARRVEAARVAEEARRAEEQRQADQRAAERRAEQEAERRADADREATGPSGGGGGGGDGYTGPRCYAPGGQTYRPC